MKRDGKPTAEPTRAPTALIIDADTATRHLLQDLLSLHGYQVHLASDVDTAIAAFRHQRPDCVLLDIRSPEPDGYELLRTIRRQPGGQCTTIVMLSTHADRRSWLAWDQGPDMFLAKPFDTHQLLTYLHTRLAVSDQNLIVTNLEPTTKTSSTPVVATSTAGGVSRASLVAPDPLRIHRTSARPLALAPSATG